MPISGIVVRCREGEAERVAGIIHDPGSVEVHHVVDPSTLVAVIDAPTVADEVSLSSGLMKVDGVISVHLAYHHFEEVQSS
ncbi:MAG: hypothetical protein Fur0034_16780 [Desulfuromonadia bacterium]